jgi:hypothetical protein
MQLPAIHARFKQIANNAIIAGDPPELPRGVTLMDAAEKFQTKAYARFLEAHTELYIFETILISATVQAEQLHDITDSLVARKGIAPKEEEWPMSLRPLERLKLMDDFLAQMILSRGVDVFLTYVSELLEAIFQYRPEMLKMSGEISVAEVLKHERMEEFAKELIERRVHSLSYKGLADLDSHLLKTTGLQLFENAAILERMVTLVEIRNIIAHNYGVVNKIFCAHVPGYESQLGKGIVLDRKQTVSELRLIKKCVQDLDDRAVAKFSLPTYSPSMVVLSSSPWRKPLY